MEKTLYCHDCPPRSGCGSAKYGRAGILEKKKLEQMSAAEWELLCDGCGKCCLNKLEIEGKIHFTCVRCRFWIPKAACAEFMKTVLKKVPDCRSVDLKAIREKPRWLPRTCAYWLLDNGQELPEWHPLVSGDKESVHRAFQSVRGRLIISESEVKAL